MFLPVGRAFLRGGEVILPDIILLVRLFLSIEGFFSPFSFCSAIRLSVKRGEKTRVNVR